jgi:hypothetical protein
MYHGAVDVPQDVLNDFLQTAQTLEVKGLAEGGANKPKVKNDITYFEIFRLDITSQHNTIPTDLNVCLYITTVIMILLLWVIVTQIHT